MPRLAIRYSSYPEKTGKGGDGTARWKMGQPGGSWETERLSLLRGSCPDLMASEGPHCSLHTFLYHAILKSCFKAFMLIHSLFLNFTSCSLALKKIIKVKGSFATVLKDD